jgi:phosphomannomutase
MTPAYIFDVDGTLTPSRQIITPEFCDFFLAFALENPVYLVSGSDYAKTVEQLGGDILAACQRVYSCSGNSVWENGVEVYASPWTLHSAAINHLKSVLYSSKCPAKTGNHFEHRPGAVNFSTVGRNANLEQRAEYVAFDHATGERESIVDTFNRCFGSKLNCVAHIGGETGIDITQTGCDKSQILRDFEGRPVHFFGDRCEPGGNDFPLAHAIATRQFTGDVVHAVTGWQDTMNRLTQIH